MQLCKVNTLSSINLDTTTASSRSTTVLLAPESVMEPAQHSERSPSCPTSRDSSATQQGTTNLKAKPTRLANSTFRPSHRDMEWRPIRT